MPFQRPTLAELRARCAATVAAALELGALLKRGTLRGIANAIAGAVHLLHGHVVHVSRQLHPETADAEQLDVLANRYGVPRKAAVAASGTLALTGSGTTLVPAGTQWVRADGAAYQSLADVSLVAGAAEVEVAALVAGAAGDADPGTVLTLASPLDGLDSDAVVVDVAGAGLEGADREPDDRLRERLLQRLSQVPQGGAEADYVRWTLEVPEVTRAWCLPLWMGPMTVGVMFTTDDLASPIPDAPKLAEVEAHLLERRPVGAQLFVVAPTPLPLDPELTISPDTPAVRQAIEEALADLVRREAAPGGTLLISRIREAISTAAGEADHVLATPSANVVAGAGELVVLGTVTFT